MKRGLTAAATVALLLLTGCTAQTQQAAPAGSEPSKSPPAAPTTDGPAITPTSEASVEPSPANTSGRDADEALEPIPDLLAGSGVNMTPELVKAAANYVCDQKEAGVDRLSIKLISDDIPNNAPGRANRVLVDMSWDLYCKLR